MTNDAKANEEISLCMEIYELSQRVRAAGHEDAANGILIHAFSIAKDDPVVWEREHITTGIQALARVAHATGHTVAADNLSAVGMAHILGKDAEQDYRYRTANATSEIMRRFKKSDHFWPEDLS